MWFTEAENTEFGCVKSQWVAANRLHSFCMNILLQRGPLTMGDVVEVLQLLLFL